MKYLPLYFEWMETGFIPTNGLCNFFGKCHDEFEVTVKRKYHLFKRIMPDYAVGSYWAVGDYYGEMWHRKFTPMRQSVVLLLAAMNGELTAKNLKQYNQR